MDNKNKKILNFFKNKKILITGHTGFKGTWLTLWLNCLGAKVMGISNGIPTKPSLFKILKLKNKITSTTCDIRDLNQFKYKLNLFKPDIIFHLAAQAIVKKSFDNPLETWTSNLIGTINLLEALKNYKKSNVRCIFITSDKVYNNVEKTYGYKENDKLGGEDPYSASKASADIAINSYINSFLKKNKKILISTARAGNVIGGGDWSEGRLIPDCIRAWSKGKKVEIRNFKSTRPWQHVLEVLYGYLSLAYNLSHKKKNLYGESFNFGPSTSTKYTVEDLLKESKKNWILAKWKLKKNNKFFKESKLLQLNISKASKQIKWKNNLSFKKTIKYTFDWYNKFYKKKFNMYQVSIDQIKKYENILISK